MIGLYVPTHKTPLLSRGYKPIALSYYVGGMSQLNISWLLLANIEIHNCSLYPQMFVTFDFYINFDHLSYSKKLKL
jgi:hypothetical protein